MAEIKRHSVLIIDDDRDYLEILRRGLGNEFEVLTISNFKSLRDEILGMRPSLIMLDKHLGETKPEDVINQIRSYDFLKDTPIFLVSGSDSGRKIASTYNLNGFMLKSANLEEVRNLIRSGLAQSV